MMDRWKDCVEIPVEFKHLSVPLKVAVVFAYIIGIVIILVVLLDIGVYL